VLLLLQLLRLCQTFVWTCISRRQRHGLFPPSILLPMLAPRSTSDVYALLSAETASHNLRNVRSGCMGGCRPPATRANSGACQARVTLTVLCSHITSTPNTSPPEGGSNSQPACVATFFVLRTHAHQMRSCSQFLAADAAVSASYLLQHQWTNCPRSQAFCVINVSCRHYTITASNYIG